MSNGMQWFGRSPRHGEAEGYILRRARHDAAEPHDLPLGQATREQRIRALVRCEVRCGGDKQLALVLILPGRITDAVDGQPHVPPSGLYVDRPKTPKAAKEIRLFREKPYDALTEDERIVRDELMQERLGFWAGVFRSEER